MDVRDILVEAAGKSASDIFIISGAPLCYKANHMLTRMSEAPLSAEDTLQMAVQIYELAGMPRQENERLRRYCGMFRLSFPTRKVWVFPNR